MLTYGVMVTQLILVQSFKVRIFVGQQKKEIARLLISFFVFIFAISTMFNKYNKNWTTTLIPR